MTIAGDCLNCGEQFLECDKKCKNCKKDPTIKAFDFFTFLMPFAISSFFHILIGWGLLVGFLILHASILSLFGLVQDLELMRYYYWQYIFASYLIVFILIKLKDKNFVDHPFSERNLNDISYKTAWVFSVFFCAPASLAIYVTKLTIQFIFDFFYYLLIKNPS